MTLVDHDEVEEIWRVFAEVGRWMSVHDRATHKRLEDGEEQARVLGDGALLANILGLDAHQRVVGKGGEGREIIIRLRCERVSVCKKKDAWSARGGTWLLPIREIPAGLK